MAFYCNTNFPLKLWLILSKNFSFLDIIMKTVIIFNVYLLRLFDFRMKPTLRQVLFLLSGVNYRSVTINEVIFFRVFPYLFSIYELFIKGEEYDLLQEGQMDKDRLLQILREIRKEHPDAGPEELERLANDKLVRR